MPKIHEMKESKFLKKEDVGTGLLLTVNGVGQENVAKQGADPEMKWVLHFEESDKPLVLNQINIQIAAQVFGSEDTDDWTGKRLYDFFFAGSGLVLLGPLLAVIAALVKLFDGGDVFFRKNTVYMIDQIRSAANQLGQ